MRRRRRSTTLTGAALDDELYELAMAAVWMESPLALFNAEISRRLRQAFHSIQIRPSAPHYTSIQLRSIDSHPDNNGTLIAGRQGKVRFHCCLVSCAVECICMLFDRIRLNILNGQKRCVKAVRAASTLKTTASRVYARVRLHFLEGAAANLSFCNLWIAEKMVHLADADLAKPERIHIPREPGAPRRPSELARRRHQSLQPVLTQSEDVPARPHPTPYPTRGKYSLWCRLDSEQRADMF